MVKVYIIKQAFNIKILAIYVKLNFKISLQIFYS